jgi:hypothetical protein
MRLLGLIGLEPALYRARQGIDPAGQLAVVVQQMVDADAAGSCSHKPDE